jgi:hypothetical protein
MRQLLRIPAECEIDDDTHRLCGPGCRHKIEEYIGKAKNECRWICRLFCTPLAKPSDSDNTYRCGQCIQAGHIYNDSIRR